MSFDLFNLHPRILANVHALGYQTPTPIQNQSIPPVLSGQDVMGLAQTGTGKTAAFALPIIQRLMSGPRSCVRALVVAPTRELAQQIHEAFVERQNIKQHIQDPGYRCYQEEEIHEECPIARRQQSPRGRAEIFDMP